MPDAAELDRLAGLVSVITRFDVLMFTYGDGLSRVIVF
jgi:hypothetical protein